MKRDQMTLDRLSGQHAEQAARATRSYVEDIGGAVHLRGDAPIYAGVHQHRGSYPQHIHSFLEIVLVTRGTGIHDCAFGRTELHPGDVLVVRPGVAHGYTRCVDLQLFNCCISTTVLDRELAWAREDPMLGPLLAPARGAVTDGVLQGTLNSGSIDDCLSPLQSLEALHQVDFDSHRPEAIAQLLLFLGRLGRSAVGNWSDDSQSLTSPLVQEAVRLLNEDLARPWTLGDMAARLHVTSHHLVRQFRSVTGQPPLAYLARRRAEVAARMLLTTDLTIGQIGSEVGWPDGNHFARRFRAHFATTPSDYRARFRAR